MVHLIISCPYTIRRLLLWKDIKHSQVDIRNQECSGVGGTDSPRKAYSKACSTRKDQQRDWVGIIYQYSHRYFAPQEYYPETGY